MREQGTINPPARAYEIFWDGKKYTARCDCCLMECEGEGSSPARAMGRLGMEAECSLRDREEGMWQLARERGETS